MDSSLPTLEAVIATLSADATVSSLIGGRIYTDVPQSAVFPYIQLGISSEPFAASDFSGQQHILTVQVFSRKSETVECLTIRKAIHAALDRKEASIVLAGLVKCEFSGSMKPFKEDDGKTWQAVSDFELIVI